MNKALYVAVIVVSWNDRTFWPGDVITFGDGDGDIRDDLMRSGAITIAASAEAVRPADPAEFDAAIAAAIAGLAENDEDAWTKGGKPQVVALEAALGYDIDAADRDRVWAGLEGE